MSNSETAKKVQSVLRELGHKVSLGHSYELLSKLGGFSSYNVASATGADLGRPFAPQGRLNPSFTPEPDGDTYKFRFHTKEGMPIPFKEEVTVTFNFNVTGSGETIADAAAEAARCLLEEVEGYGSDCRTLEHNIVEIEGNVERIPIENQYDIGIEKLLKSAQMMSKVAGGTVSSGQLKNALIGRKLITRDVPEGEKKNGLLAKVDRLVEMWRNALERHNGQPEKFVEYDIETGEEIQK
jgi:hypothetical protein